MAYLLEKPDAQQDIETQMKKLDAEVDWPLLPIGAIQLKCVIDYKDPHYAAKMEQWPKMVGKNFSQIIENMFDEDQVNTLQEVWSKVGLKFIYIVE